MNAKAKGKAMKVAKLTDEGARVGAPMCDVAAMIAELRNTIRYDAKAALETLFARTGIAPQRIIVDVEIEPAPAPGWKGRPTVSMVRIDFSL